jgi:hypothetical protein
MFFPHILLEITEKAVPWRSYLAPSKTGADSASWEQPQPGFGGQTVEPKD